MKYLNLKKLLYLLILPALILPAVAFGLENDYSSIFGISMPENPKLEEYISYFANIGISASMIFAVIVIIFGGLQYLIFGALGKSTSEGKEWVKSGILGLFLLITSYIILATINPALVNPKFAQLLEMAPFLNLSTTPAPIAPKQIFYKEIPIGILTEDILSEKIDCYEFDENGNPVPKEIKNDKGNNINGPSFLEKDRADCMANIGEAIERKTNLVEKLSDEIVKLMETCACNGSKCENVKDEECPSNPPGGTDPQAGKQCSEILTCGKTHCKCPNPEVDLCPDGIKDKIQHGPIIFGGGINFPNFWFAFPGASYKDISDFYKCLEKKDFGNKKIYKGLDEFRTTLTDVSLIIDTTDFVNKKEITIIDVNKFADLKLVEQLMYLNDKLNKIAKTLSDDSKNLESASDELNKCYKPKTYVDYIKIDEQTNKENQIIMVQKNFNSYENKFTDTTKYCNGFGYSQSKCLYDCEDMCPSSSPEAISCFDSCADCDLICPDEDPKCMPAKNICLAEQKTCVEDCYNKRPCPNSATGIPNFGECVLTCKNECSDSCIKNYTSCSKALDACEDCLPEGPPPPPPPKKGFDFTNYFCDNCQQMCPTQISAPLGGHISGEGIATCGGNNYSENGICANLNECDHFPTGNIDVTLGCYSQMSACRSVCQGDNFFQCAKSPCSAPPFNCPAMPSSTCDKMCGTCDYIDPSNIADWSYCQFFIKPVCLSSCNNAINTIKNWGAWSCSKEKTVPLQNKNQCINTAQACKGVCSSSTAVLTEENYNICSNCLQTKIGMGLPPYTAPPPPPPPTDRLNCDPVLKDYCGDEYKKCQSNCQNDSSCVLNNKEKCLYDPQALVGCVDTSEDEENNKNCIENSGFSCQYGSSQYPGYTDCLKNPFSSGEFFTSSYIFQNLDKQKCPNPFSTNNSGPCYSSQSPNSKCGELCPETLKCPSASKCPDCPCGIVTDFKEVSSSATHNICNNEGKCEQATGSGINECGKDSDCPEYRVAGAECESYKYNDDSLTFYCPQNWWEDKELQRPEPLSNEFSCPKEKEIPVGQAVDNTQKWAKEFLKITGNFIQKTSALIQHLTTIGLLPEDSYGKCDSLCDDGESACNVPCLANEVPDVDNNGNPIIKCKCVKSVCEGNPFQKVINLLKGKGKEELCPKGQEIEGIKKRHENINENLKIINESVLIDRSDILKQLIYSRKKMFDCSGESKANTTADQTKLVSCTIRMTNFISPKLETIINGQKIENYCYGVTAGLIYDASDVTTDNWFCCSPSE